MKPSSTCLQLIRHFEGLRLVAYPDPGTGGKPWTIGYGRTGGVLPGARCSEEDAERWLADDALRSSEAVLRLVRVPLLQCELDALTSFAFNLGPYRLAGSTLLRLLNASTDATDRAAVADQFLRWNKAAGKVLPGLVARREATHGSVADRDQEVLGGDGRMREHTQAGVMQVERGGRQGRPARRWRTLAIAMHLRWLAEQHVHRQVDGVES